MTTSASELSVELLGAIRVRFGDRRMPVGPPRQQAVFAVLVLRVNTAVARDELIDAVWGEDVPSNAVGSLYTYVSGLRRLLYSCRPEGSAERHLLVSEGAGYALRLPALATDVERFDALRSRAYEEHLAGELVAELATLEAALELWHGEPLSGVPGPYAAAQRHRLAELRLVAIERRAEVALTLGRHGELIAELDDMARNHPMRESLRGLQMLALYRSGRAADALDVYRDVRNILINELGIEPGPDLQRLQQQVLTNDPALRAVAPPAAAVSRAPSATPDRQAPLVVVPLDVSARWEQGLPRLIGREEETEMLRARLADLMAGRGATVWIEGESGIGKSALLATALAEAANLGCQIAWAAADELGQQFPYSVIRECLGAERAASHPRIDELFAVLKQSGKGRPPEPGDPALVLADRLLTLIEELCTQAPLLLVVDDLQWADEASLLMWHRLAGVARRLPLLLVSASRVEAHRSTVVRLRGSLEFRGAHMILLRALSREHTHQLIAASLGGRPGPKLRQLADRAAGNPLYLHEMLDSMTAAGHLTISHEVADLDESAHYEAPASLLSAVTRRLAPLTGETRDILRVAAILGTEFAVTELASVLGRPALSLLAPIDRCVEAKALVDASPRLAFRHPLVREAVLDGMPLAMRRALSREAAQVLAGTGAAVDRVAQLLAEGPVSADPWLVDWLTDHESELIARAPAVALDLLEKVVPTLGWADPRWQILAAGLVRVQVRLDRSPLPQAREVLAHTRDPERVAELRYLLATSLYRDGQIDRAVSELRAAIADESVPDLWLARHKALLASYICTDDLDAAHALAADAVTRAERAGDLFTGVYALQALWRVDAVGRDHEMSLAHIDRAIEIAAATPHLVGLHFSLLETRAFCLQNLDRLTEAGDALAEADQLATKYQLPGHLEAPTAVHLYWLGRWDEALAQLDAVVEDGRHLPLLGVRSRAEDVQYEAHPLGITGVIAAPAALLLHGVAALIGARRGDGGLASAHLAAASAYPLVAPSTRECSDFFLFAQVVALEQRGEPVEALARLDPLLQRDFAPMMLRHQWLPDLVRGALEVGDRTLAEAGLRACEAEAEKERLPHRAFMARQRCRGLVAADPGPVLEAAAHYRSVGRLVEQAEALEDGAALLADRDRRRALRALEEALAIYTDLGAAWDIERTERRLAARGIHRSRVSRATTAARRRPESGEAGAAPAAGFRIS
jgi:DNA-binding SARP family transcriptional activator